MRTESDERGRIRVTAEGFAGGLDDLLEAHRKAATKGLRPSVDSYWISAAARHALVDVSKERANGSWST
jgi:hypothetical protein